MNWKDDKIEKLILFYSHNSLFLVPEILKLVGSTRKWYHDSGIPVFWYQFLVPVSGQYVKGISACRLIRYC